MPSRARMSSASVQAAWQPPTVRRPSLAPGVVRTIGAGTNARRALNLAIDAIEHVDVLVAVLGVGAVAVVAGAAREVRALGMDSRQRAIRDAVAVDVEIAGEALRLLELLRRQHLAAIGPVAVVPGQLRDHPVVHADVEVAQHEDRRLEPLGEVERLRPTSRTPRAGRRDRGRCGGCRRATRRRRASGRPAACASACPSTARCAGRRRSPPALRRSRPGR